MLKEIEEKAGVWSDVTAPIFGNSDKKFVTAEGFGTGFIASIEGDDDLYFLTALHVVQDFKHYSVVVANISGKAFDLTRLQFHGNSDYDFAFALLKKEILLELGLLGIKHCPLDRDWSLWEPSDIFVAMGYPASRNVLKAKFNSTDRNCFNLFSKRSSLVAKKTSLRKHLALNYNPKDVRLSGGEQLNPPDLQGMSGGPCFQLMTQSRDHEISFSFRLSGITSEFHAKEKIIAIAPIELLRGEDR